MKKITHIVFDHDGTLVNTAKIPSFAYEGIEDLLKFLLENGVLLYVWTARSKESARRILDEVKLLKYFEAICGGYDALSKPSPSGIEYLVPGTSPENVVVIGDSLGDIIGGHKFGATALGAMWAHGNNYGYDGFKEHGAEESFETVASLKKFIESYIEVKNV